LAHLFALFFALLVPPLDTPGGPIATIVITAPMPVAAIHEISHPVDPGRPIA
jgi:hypothetical protein